jgi:DNA-binding PadR family transcriptional regulator
MKRLSDRGLVKRVRDRVDARAYRVQLTSKGQQELAAVAPAERRALDMLLSSLTQQDRQGIIPLLESLAGIAETAESDAELPSSGL